ncbi:MAG: dihydroorotate dehydrogenase electron transfer subunit [Candidatus Bathyarchaeia archaeon]
MEFPKKEKLKTSAYPTATNKLRTTRILSIQAEGLTVKTFTFKDLRCLRAKPGQFLMLWVPGVDEIPLSILNVDGDGMVSVAVKKVGEATEALHNRKIGDFIGVRGPFGNNFSLKGDRVLIVGGGTGLAPLLFLAKKLTYKVVRLVFVAGAKTRDDLLFLDELEKVCGKENLVAATEDGSYGVHGLATTPLERLLAEEKFDMIYTCGPERMMRSVFDLAERYKIALEASLERLMRCAIGLCGSCIIGKYRVCRDGPVFTAHQLREVIHEFGVSKLDFTGEKVPVE